MNSGTMRAGIGSLVALTTLSSCATSVREKPVLTRSAVQSIVRACHAVSGEFHRDAKTLPYANFVVRKADVRDNMADMCFAQKMAGYRYSQMGFREDGAPAAE